MDAKRRSELLARTASVQPPSLTPPIPGAPAAVSRGYEIVPSPDSDDAKVQASKRGAHLPPGTVKGFGPSGTNVTMTEGPAQPAQSVNVRGAAPVSGPSMGASVTMHGASRATGVRGAQMVEHGRPVAPAGIGPQPARQIATPSSAPSRAWGGAAAIPTVTPTAAAAPIIDLTIMLSQRARPNLIEHQRRAIDTSTVRPAAVACFVNPVGVQLNDRALNGIATIKAGMDMGPWMRWLYATETTTKYVLLLDDDCIPGINWIRLAYDRLELAEQRGEKIIVAPGGLVYQSDNFDDVYPVGPEAPRIDESIVDLARGGWMMPRDLLWRVLMYPRLGSTPGTQRLAVAIHVSAALQEADPSRGEDAYQIVVLPNSPADVSKAGWGMRDAPMEQGSTSQMIDAEHKKNNDHPSWWYRQDAYTQYRAAGWEPIEVMAAASTTQLSQEQFAPSPVPPAIAPLAKNKDAKAKEEPPKEAAP